MAIPRGLHGAAVACIFEAMPAPTNPDTIRAVLETFAAGVPLATACEQFRIADNRTYALLRDNPVWRDAWATARERHAAALVRQMVELAETDPDPARARNRIAVRQWVASRMARETWGDRVDIAVEQRVSITAALEAADARARPIRDLSRVVDAETVELAAIPALTAADNESVTPRDALPDPFD